VVGEWTTAILGLKAEWDGFELGTGADRCATGMVETSSAYVTLRAEGRWPSGPGTLVGVLGMPSMQFDTRQSCDAMCWLDHPGPRSESRRLRCR
jgi:hypothetical protein